MLALRHRLAQQAPALEPPLDYRPTGYTAAAALSVMRTYSADARLSTQLLEVGRSGGRRAAQPRSRPAPRVVSCWRLCT